MPIPTLTSPANPNPTIGNPFNTEAVVNNTLLTSIKADFSTLENYYNLTGWENQYLANQSVQSEQLYPQAVFNRFGSGTTVLNTLADTFMSDEISINIPVNNAKVIFQANINWILSQVSGTAGSDMSEVDYYLESNATPGFAAAAGTAVLPPGGVKTRSRDGQTNNFLIGNTPLIAVDTVATAGNRYYRFTAKENQNVLFNRTINRATSTYFYWITNGFS